MIGTRSLGAPRRPTPKGGPGHDGGWIRNDRWKSSICTRLLLSIESAPTTGICRAFKPLAARRAKTKKRLHTCAAGARREPCSSLESSFWLLTEKCDKDIIQTLLVFLARVIDNTGWVPVPAGPIQLTSPVFPVRIPLLYLFTFISPPPFHFVGAVVASLERILLSSTISNTVSSYPLTSCPEETTRLY